MKAEVGVYFRRDDYATFWRRLLVTTVDGIVIGTVSLLLLFVLVRSPTRTALNLLFGALLIFVFVYAVVLQRTGIRTLGYRLGKIRIVGVDGQPPSACTLTLRCLFIPLGPLNWFLDFLWISGDSHRQSLRDKFAHTYVVKLNAEPSGKGKIVYRQYDIWGMNLTMQEIEPAADNTGAQGDLGSQL